MMGQFSYIAQDTHEAILIGRNPETTLIDDKGNTWTCEQDKYEGYGIFGGKDFYELVAEMNGLKGRDAGIDIVFPLTPDGVTGPTYKSPNLIMGNPKDWKYDANLVVEDDPRQGWDGYDND